MTEGDEIGFFTPDRPVENGTANIAPATDRLDLALRWLHRLALGYRPPMDLSTPHAAEIAAEMQRLRAIEAAAAVPAPEVETEEQWAHWFTGRPYGCKSPEEAVRSGVLHRSPDKAAALNFVSYAPDWRLARRTCGPWTPVDPEEQP